MNFFFEKNPSIFDISECKGFISHPNPIFEETFLFFYDCQFIMKSTVKCKLSSHLKIFNCYLEPVQKLRVASCLPPMHPWQNMHIGQ